MDNSNINKYEHGPPAMYHHDTMPNNGGEVNDYIIVVDQQNSKIEHVPYHNHSGVITQQNNGMEGHNMAMNEMYAMHQQHQDCQQQTTNNYQQDLRYYLKNGQLTPVEHVQEHVGFDHHSSGEEESIPTVPTIDTHVVDAKSMRRTLSAGNQPMSSFNLFDPFIVAHPGQGKDSPGSMQLVNISFHDKNQIISKANGQFQDKMPNTLNVQNQNGVFAPPECAKAKADKKEKVRLRNAVSAKRNRQKKKEYLQFLEKRVKALEMDKTELQLQVRRAYDIINSMSGESQSR
jgi:hypothetical protein